MANAAPPILQVHDLVVSRAGRAVLRGLSMSLAAGEILALVGANGSGKSTLLCTIAGELSAERGEVLFSGGGRPRLLSQISRVGPAGETGRERIWTYSPRLDALRRAIDAGSYESIGEYQTLGGYELEREVQQRVGDFGVEEALERPYAELSPGQQRKVDLVGALLGETRLLLLDEPVNYLDLTGIRAFAVALTERRSRGAACLLVSHDRQLVDDLADRTALLADGRLEIVHGGYTALEAHRRREAEARRHRSDVLERRIRGLEVDMRRRKGWGIRKEQAKSGAGAAKPYIAKRAKKMLKRAKEVERRLEKERQRLVAEKPRRERRVHLRFENYPVRRRTVARLEEVHKSFAGKRVLAGASFELWTEDRVGLVGDNGAGKTTLLEILRGGLEVDRGRVERSPGVRVGWIPQELAGVFSSGTLLDHLAVGPEDEPQVRTLLGAAQLPRDKALVPVASLSFGERMRGALVKLILERSEVLILDEPTTHLDLESIEVLESMLAGFPGGFLLVSHDRRLLATVCNEVLVLEAGRLERLSFAR